MIERKKKIFGKNYTFVAEETFELALSESTALYPENYGEYEDVLIEILSTDNQELLLSRNPEIFSKYENSIGTKFSQCNVYWKKVGKKLEIRVIMNEGLLNFSTFSRFRSMEFPTSVEIFMQILHELVLIPSVYFFEDLSLVHAAGFSVRDEGILLAGTGGTGKTSALLALRKNDKLSFITDDIAVISSDGLVYPNLAWPKVYGYNLSSYIKKEELLSGRSFLDKVHFGLKLKVNPKKVRRKIRPNILYANVNLEPVKLSKVIYLFRDNVEKLEFRKLDKNKAIEAGLNVIKTEYEVFNKFLEWDNYNSIIKNVHPILRLEEVFKNWNNTLNSAFLDSEVNSLHIPYKIPHEDYLKFIENQLINE
ncbi:hypothetical protein KIH41_16355 [Litoribacter ruber]|uniref:hypothetical protein n=1 Tax=Litoribacter ruber TaxID=702568 RepID=UPI001BDB35FE|nr:hypothetical protein [Litoribacter ruber]MBT0812860.1 hypothetical protein [Litoribacter ruber]